MCRRLINVLGIGPIIASTTYAAAGDPFFSLAGITPEISGAGTASAELTCFGPVLAVPFGSIRKREQVQARKQLKKEKSPGHPLIS